MLFIMLPWSVPCNVDNTYKCSVMFCDSLPIRPINNIHYFFKAILLIVVNKNVCMYNYAMHCKKKR